MSQRLEKALQCMTAELKQCMENLQEAVDSIADRPVVGNAVCVTVDGTATYAAALRMYDTTTGTLSTDATWVNPDTLAPITGTVVVADPCDCDCLTCP